MRQVVGGAENYVASCRACYHSYNDSRSGSAAAPEPKGTPTSAYRSAIISSLATDQPKHQTTCLVESSSVKFPGFPGKSLKDEGLVLILAQVGTA